jgi:hypothetical protein
MGSSWSSTFSTPGTPETKQILNTILARLIKEVDMNDMYSLADPIKCKEYIVVATTALDKVFAKIRIDKTSDGTLLFQKISGIKDKNPDPRLQQQRCKELAFFFIRIFQIYAAISLSIMDSELPATDPVEVLDTKGKRDKRIVFIRPDEGFKGFPQKRGWFSGLMEQTGGRLDQGTDGPTTGNFYLDPLRAGPYQVLNRFLVVPTNRMSKDDALTFKSSSGSSLPMTISQESLYDFVGDARTTKDFNTGVQTPKIYYVVTRGSERKLLEANLKFIQEQEGGNFKVRLEGIQIRGGKPAGDSEKTLTDILGDKNPKNESNNEVPAVLEAMFKEAYNNAVPPIFSAATFLKEKGVIRSMDGVVNIEGTNIFIINPRDQQGDRLKVIYKTRHKIDAQTRPVEIYTEVIIEKRKKTVLEEQKYFVRVDFNEVTTKPDDLIDELNIQAHTGTERFRGKERYFTTGSSDTSRPVSEKGESIPIFLETVFKNLLLERDEFETRDGIRYTRDGFPEPYNSERIPPEMRIKELWKALAKDPPVKAHCVARALQLLNLSAIRGTETKEAFSSICRVKFPYAKDGSLPPAGSPITEEYGILSLAMLFVDKLVAGSPQITQTNQYKEFRKKFKFFFERYEESQIDEIAAPDKLSQIDEKIMPGLCEGHTKDRILVDNSTVYELQRKAKILLDRQATHIRSCMTILFKLFNEQAVRSGRFEVSTYVQENGMEAVNQLAEETRNMLIQYYGDCEQTYKEGVFILYNKYKKNKDSIKYNRVDN